MALTRWALQSKSDERIKKEMELQEKRISDEANDYIAELRAYDLIDNGIAYEVEGIEFPQG